MFSRLLGGIALIVAVLIVIGAGLAGVGIAVTYPRLPSLDVLTAYRPKIPLRVYTADGALIGEFGEERRSFTPIGEVPPLMKKAILAAEDERFYEHGGIDYLGIARAAVANVTTGHIRSGASTITMQVAKNFFLSSERTFTRKFNEALLAFKIEHNLSKDQILELYYNQIYLGQRAYGFTSAAQIYFGKTLDQLTPAEMAMLAGLPKAPSSYNPVVNPERAHLRQLYVLRRMRELNFIDNDQYEAAKQEKLKLASRNEDFSVPAQYVAEMVRQSMYTRYKEAAYTEGFRVYTTLKSDPQRWAFDAVREGLMSYDRRHGYRGPESFIDLAALPEDSDRDEALDDALAAIRDSGSLQPAVVLEASPTLVRVYLRGGGKVDLRGRALSFAQRFLSPKLTPAQRIRPGSIIRITKDEDGGWSITQMPKVEGAFVAVDPKTGAIQSLVGGFDFNRNHFNRVTMAWRQPGSSFKPFIYSAGLERGFTPSTLVNDAPLVIDPQTIGGQRWEPKNYDGRYAGMMTLRRGLTLSKNLVSIRVLMATGTDYTQQYLQRFDFGPKQHPAYLTMALGAGMVTPLGMAEGYSVFANGGWQVKPYFIDRIEDSLGHVLAKTAPIVAGQNARQVIDPRNAFIMTNLMQDVVKFGTGRSALSLGRSDLAGKTGTTNDSRDAWFAGFAPGELVGIAWVGFDNNKSLGGGETGGGAALPIWISYMRHALKSVPEVELPVPSGIVVKPGAGLHGQPEYYYQEFLQTSPELGLNNQASRSVESNEADPAASPSTPPPDSARDAVENVKEQLF
ncbi:penicillin-binding protein 1A [Microvirgula aerodenitrificans]|uniref:penicillin-binding protein 1A n=1 Tax=Microvirgula aerodenitrificans TaxID=57480 RepID=UPI00248DE7AE|nr:penicillin-binding protein 1A [Microvirgula aerodenitrificans]